LRSVTSSLPSALVLVRTPSRAGDVEHYEHAMTLLVSAVLLLSPQHTIGRGEEGCSQVPSRTRDRWFESPLLQRRVTNELSGCQERLSILFHRNVATCDVALHEVVMHGRRLISRMNQPRRSRNSGSSTAFRDP
jgi:hypothetical protein